MTHDALREKLLDLAYGELSSRDARRVEDHAASCDACRAELGRIRQTRKLMAALPSEAAPERGENVLLAAARERSRLSEPRWKVPRWVLAGSVAASLVAVAAVSYRISDMRSGSPGKYDHDALLGEAHPGREAAPPQAPAAASYPASPAPAEETRNEVAAAPRPPAPGSGVARERQRAEPFRSDREGARYSLLRRSSAGQGKGAHRDDLRGSSLPRTGGGEGQGVGALGPPRSASAAPPGFAEPPPSAAGPPVAMRRKSSGNEPEAEAPEARGGARGDLADARAVAAPRAKAARERSAPGARAAPAAPVGQAQPPKRSAAEVTPPGFGSGDLGVVADREEAPAANRRGTTPGAATPPAARAEDAMARWQSLRAAGKLRTEVRRFSGCEPDSARFVESFRKLERDPQGRVVRLEMRGSIEGRTFEAEGFYDAAGVLRVERWRQDGAGVTERRHPASGPANTRFPARASGASIGAPGRCDG